MTSLFREFNEYNDTRARNVDSIHARIQKVLSEGVKL